MAFEGLTEKISAAFKKLRGKGRLKEADVKEAMREIRMALLEADVSYKVVKDFVKSVSKAEKHSRNSGELASKRCINVVKDRKNFCKKHNDYDRHQKKEHYRIGKGAGYVAFHSFSVFVIAGKRVKGFFGASDRFADL